MASNAIATAIQMLELLPDSMQEQAVQHLREYVTDLLDELEWQECFRGTQASLGEAGRQARAQIAEGKAAPLNYDEL